MPRRAIGVSDFDIVAQDNEGAMHLWRIIHQEPAKFQAARSLYMQISPDKLDTADDDQWAMALEAIRPGNIRHNLKAVKIMVVSNKLLEPYSSTTLSPSSLGRAHAQRPAKSGGGKPAKSEPSMVFFAERALIKALSNIRGIEKVEIAGPMEASLKKMLAVAMTTRPGGVVREWRYGGGLRSEDDISWGSWSATMQPAGDSEQAAGDAAYVMERFDCQIFLPPQAMQLVTAEGVGPNTMESFEKKAKEVLPPECPVEQPRKSMVAAASVDGKRADSHLSDGRSEMAAARMTQKSAPKGESKAGTESGQGDGSGGSTTMAGVVSHGGAYEQTGAKGAQQAGRGGEDAEVEEWEGDAAEVVDGDDSDDEDYQD